MMFHVFFIIKVPLAQQLRHLLLFFQE